MSGLGQFIHDSSAGTYDYNFFLQDHLGSTRNALDESKNLLASLSYTPYGEELQFGGKLPSPRYTGHHWDQETGMYFAPFRYYMPGAGRWLSKEPLGFLGGQNLYWYAANNPIAYIDPDGRFAFMLPILASALIGAVAGYYCAGWQGAAVGVGLGVLGGFGAAAAIVGGLTGGAAMAVTAVTAVPAAAGFGALQGAMRDQQQGRRIQPTSMARDAAISGALAGFGSLTSYLDDVPILSAVAFDAHNEALANTATTVPGCSK